MDTRSYLVRLEVLSLHAVFPEGQDTVLKAHWKNTQVSTLAANAYTKYSMSRMVSSSKTKTPEEVKFYRHCTQEAK